MMEQTPAQPILDPTRRYFFVGIGGIGMSAIARVLLARGMRVAGADAKASPMLETLRALGAEVFVGHAAEHIRPDDVLVRSDAIKADNPEWLRAQELGLSIFKRADVLGALTNAGRGVAVSGTHGKTTTSGMLALMLVEAGFDPTCVLGGELTPLGGNARTGGDLTVVEACEAYNSFLDLHPEAALVTNIEVDHLDFHGTPAHLFDSFRQFLRQVRGFAVVHGDDPLLRTMGDLAPRTITYGQGEENDYRVVDVQLGAEPAFTLLRHGSTVGRLTLRVPGLHNVLDAAGAAALALELGAEFAAIQRAMVAFPGMHRRFERIGRVGEVAVIDDYAHHPTEVRATLTAAHAAFPGRVVVLFQPHLFSRTRDLLEEFAQAFTLADVVLIAPIYPAREAPIPGVSHTQLVARIAALAPGLPVVALSSVDEAVRMLTHAVGGPVDSAQPALIPALGAGDVICTMGAGDIDRVAYALMEIATACAGER